MATKTTSKSTSKKPASPGTKPKAGKGTAARADAGAPPVKSLLPKITARAPKKEEQPKEAPKTP